MIAIFFIVDRLLKLLALSMGAENYIPIAGDLFLFHFTPNPYISFSLPLSGWLLYTLIFSIVALLIAYIIYLIRKKRGQKYEVALLTIILFGAISNIIDRCLYGYVIDYLELKYFTVFNLADVMISGGAIILILMNFKNPKKYES
jgi:signal peptidase II